MGEPSWGLPPRGGGLAVGALGPNASGWGIGNHAIPPLRRAAKRMALEERSATLPPIVEKILLINADEPEEVRVAVVEDGRLEEVYVEAGSDPTGKGNIYVGRVQNVERGIGAAFVDLGHGVTGFLHASDIAEPPAGRRRSAPPLT